MRMLREACRKWSLIFGIELLDKGKWKGKSKQGGFKIRLGDGGVYTSQETRPCLERDYSKRPLNPSYAEIRCGISH